MVHAEKMPDIEKLACVLDAIDTERSFVPLFVREHAGEQAVADLKQAWQAGYPIPEDASIEEQYEIAYANWIYGAKTIFEFICSRLGEDGIDKFKRADVEVLKRKNASPALLMLSLLRLVAPGRAFVMTAKKVAYQLQWLSPYRVSELSERRLVLDIPSCKVLDFPDSEDICQIGCQGIYPMWLAEQLKVRMEADRQGNCCKLLFSPLRQ